MSALSRGPSPLGRVVVGLWLAVHAVFLARGLLPLPAPWSGQLPWRMFFAPSEVETEILAEGKDRAGRRVPIPLRDYFHFTRGATDEPLYEESRILSQPGHQEERAAFARWLADRMAAAGTPLREVRLLQRRTRPRDGKTRVRTLGRFEVDDAAP